MNIGLFRGHGIHAKTQETTPQCQNQQQDDDPRNQGKTRQGTVRSGHCEWISKCEQDATALL